MHHTVQSAHQSPPLLQALVSYSLRAASSLEICTKRVAISWRIIAEPRWILTQRLETAATREYRRWDRRSRRQSISHFRLNKKSSTLSHSPARCSSAQKTCTWYSSGTVMNGFSYQQKPKFSWPSWSAKSFAISWLISSSVSAGGVQVYLRSTNGQEKKRTRK